MGNPLTGGITGYQTYHNHSRPYIRPVVSAFIFLAQVSAPLETLMKIDQAQPGLLLSCLSSSGIDHVRPIAFFAVHADIADIIKFTTDPEVRNIIPGLHYVV